MGFAPAMSGFRSRLLHGLLPACLALVPAVRAADLGPIMVTSPVGKPLEGSLSLSLAPGESADQLQVGIGLPAEYGWLEIERPAWIDEVAVGIASDGGETLIRLSSKEPPPDRRFSLLLVASSPLGRSLRQYDVVLYEPEVLQPPQSAGPPPEAPPAEAPAALAEEAAPAAAMTEPPPRRPARRTLRPVDRGTPDVRRDLSISSAATRVPEAGPEKRAQRLEESAAAQARALGEANARISELQGQVAKLEKLLALKGAAAVSQEAAKPAPEKPPAAAEAPGKPTADAAKAPLKDAPADAAKVPASAAAGAAQAPAAVEPAKPSVAAAAGASPADAASPPPEESGAGEAGRPAADAASGEAKTVKAAEAPAEESLFSLDQLTSYLPLDRLGLDHLPSDRLAMIAGGAVLALLLGVLGLVWWRRRRERRDVMAATLASAAAGAAALPADASAAAVAEPEPSPASEAPAETIDQADAEVQADAEAAAAGTAEAEQAVGESFAADLDAAFGDAEVGEVGEVESPPATPVATLEAVTAEAEPAATAAADDDLESMFSAESIAAAQAAIAATAAAAPDATEEEPDLQALLAGEAATTEVTPAAAADEIPDLEALLAEEAGTVEAPPAAAADEVPDLEALLAEEMPAADGSSAPAAGEGVPDLEALLAEEAAPAAATETVVEDFEDDSEDLEVNLAKAYIDMGDPEGASAILEGMLADADNPDRVQRAQRMVSHFGLQPRMPTMGESDT